MIRLNQSNLDLTLSGYLHPSYIASLEEFGVTYPLSGSGGWMLKRQIPGTDWYDAMGCHPILVCQDWSKLSSDLEMVKSELVSFKFITDPFGKFENTDLKNTCDKFLFYKEALLSDLSEPPENFVSKHHRYYARKALKEVSVEISTEPMDWLEDWCLTFNFLIDRHQIKGIRAYSRRGFALQFAVPGIIAFKAVYQKQTIGMLLTFIQGENAYHHLTAYSPEGYRFGAAYALYWTSLQYLKDKVRLVLFGGAAGPIPEKTSSLTSFKSGWTNSSLPTYLGCKIFDKGKYNELVEKMPLYPGGFFPAYRAGEFRS